MQPRSIVTSVSGPITSSPGWACGWAPRSCEATIVSNESPSAPPSWKSSRTCQATSLSLRPGQALARERCVHRLDQRRRRAHGVELVGVLHDPQPLDQPGDRHEPGVRLGQDRVALDGQLGRLEADPARAACEVAQPVGGRADHVALGELDVHPLAQRLRRRLVAEVGQEGGGVRAEDDQRVRAREAGQVADVHEAGDDHRVDPGGLHRRPGRGQSGGVVHALRPVTCSSASR